MALPYVRANRPNVDSFWSADINLIVQTQSISHRMTSVAGTQNSSHARAMKMTTQVIDDGDGQIVLIPAEFAFAGEAVRIRREGDAVVLEPLGKDEDRRRSIGGESTFGS
jgi:virulence-associated protein VagC